MNYFQQDKSKSNIQTEPEASTSNYNKRKKQPQRSNINMEEILRDETDEENPSEKIVQEFARTSETKKKNNREKFDSGIGEEIIEAPLNESSDSSDSENHMEVESNESTDEFDEEERGNKRGSKDEAPGTKWRKVTVSSNRISGGSTENGTTQDGSRSIQDEIRMIPSPYTAHMKRKIQELPLPSILKNYLNFYREF